jgi:hypothetical protein
LNKVLIDEGREIIPMQRKVDCQNVAVHQYQKKIKKLRQQSSNIKGAHKEEIKNISKVLSDNNEESYPARNHNKNLLAEVKMLKMRRRHNKKRRNNSSTKNVKRFS